MSPRRFTVVHVNGQFYECEIPLGFRYVRTFIEFTDGQIARVWIEGVDEAKPVAQDDGSDEWDSCGDDV